MRTSDGSRRSAIGCRTSANKCSEMTGDDLSATLRTATLNVALARKQKFILRHYRQSRAFIRQNGSFAACYCKSRVPARLFPAYMADELSRVCRCPRPRRLKRRMRRLCSGPAHRLEGKLDRQTLSASVLCAHPPLGIVSWLRGLHLAALFPDRCPGGRAGDRETHGLSIFGDLAMPAGFSHFPY